MNVQKNQEKSVTYCFNTLNVGPKADHVYRPSISRVEGIVGRYDFVHPPDDFYQVKNLYRNILTAEERNNLISNICHSLGACRQDIRDNMLRLFFKVDEDYGTRVAKGLGMNETSSFFEKIGKAIWLTTEKGHLSVQDDPSRVGMMK